MKEILVPVETFIAETETRERHYVSLEKLAELMKTRGLLCNCACTGKVPEYTPAAYKDEKLKFPPFNIDGTPIPDDFE